MHSLDQLDCLAATALYALNLLHTGAAKQRMHRLAIALAGGIVQRGALQRRAAHPCLCTLHMHTHTAAETRSEVHTYNKSGHKAITSYVAQRRQQCDNIVQ